MNDLISRSALLEHIKDLPTWWSDGGGFFQTAVKYPGGMFYPEDIISSVENAPTIDPESLRPHGRWIVRGQDIFCSECKCESGHNAFGASSFSDYCPNCGAKMDGDE